MGYLTCQYFFLDDMVFFEDMKNFVRHWSLFLQNVAIKCQHLLLEGSEDTSSSTLRYTVGHEKFCTALVILLQN